MNYQRLPSTLLRSLTISHAGTCKSVIARTTPTLRIVGCAYSRQLHETRLASSQSNQQQTQSIVNDSKSATLDPNSFQPSFNPVNSESGNVSRNKFKWDKETDEMIIKLHGQKRSWKEIDLALGRPPSSCYNRYYTALDPNLEAWTLVNGKQNLAMLQRLEYLVDVKKLQFSTIEKERLLDEFIVTRKGGPIRTQTGGSKHKGNAIINKVTMQKKYKDFKIMQAKQAFMQEEAEVTKAIRRNVEIYGENWIKVAAAMEDHFKRWDAKNSGSEASKQNAKKNRRRMTPAYAAELYASLQQKGNRWGLEDDVVMARKVLHLSQTHPNILEILAPKTPSVDSSDETENEARTTKEFKDGGGDLSDQYWREIAIALGNHSPEQCKERWQGLWRLHDEEKSAQSKMWHRFEKLQFWTIWQHFYRIHRSKDGGAQNHKPLGEFTKLCEELSFAKEISRWMRHRNTEQCVKHFTTVVRQGIMPANPERAVKEQPRSREERMKLKLANQKAQEERDQMFLTWSGINLDQNTLLDLIHDKVAALTVTKLSQINPGDALSTRNDPQQAIVRSDWTLERIHTLQDMVLKEKQGVQRSDSDLDWDQIARRLEEIEKKRPERQSNNDTIYMSAKHCQKCWTYLSDSIRHSGNDRMNSSDGNASAVDGGRQEWSDLEIKLLHQGVRRYGTSWADIRAQFLPNRDVSELYPQWRRLVAQGSGKEGVDRLLEPDFVGLLSALDRVTKETK
ncbi:hypothetical protein BGZ94_002020 [Podila epigama]|nr:hypothetical protein BGZ94_002020 [Podila epigama]